MASFSSGLPAEVMRLVCVCVCLAAQYVTHTVEVESADSQKALAELQTKNAGLQEQLCVQRQLLRELETQLHESQRSCAQLRTQVASAAHLSAAHLYPSSRLSAGRLSLCLSAV